MISMRINIEPIEQVEFIQACKRNGKNTQDVLASMVRASILLLKYSRPKAREQLKLKLKDYGSKRS